MKREDFRTDGKGNITTDAVRGWYVAPIADIAVFLAVQHADHPTENDKDCIVTQFSMTTRQAQDLSDQLRRQVEQILRTPTDKPLT